MDPALQARMSNELKQRRHAWPGDQRLLQVSRLEQESRRAWRVALVLVAIAGACAKPLPPAPAPPSPEAAPGLTSMSVVATAYNSLQSQTDDDPTMTAHGVELAPGMRVIAVSRDLEAMGLARGTRVRIEGLPGEWTVADRMADRWKRRIDVYMGNDVDRARRFGRREVRLQWRRPLRQSPGAAAPPAESAAESSKSASDDD